jgi:outer membrane receptor protein involved in Fe transport
MGNIGLSPGWDTSYYRNYRAAYIQDDWRFNSKLTVNLGVRYDFIQPDSSKAGDLANFVIDIQSVTALGAGIHPGIRYRRGPLCIAFARLRPASLFRRLFQV